MCVSSIFIVSERNKDALWQKINFCPNDDHDNENSGIFVNEMLNYDENECVKNDRQKRSILSFWK